MKLVIIGPQGSGKGTQAVFLAKRLGAQHLSPGEILREEERRGTRVGREAGALIREGRLLPDELVWSMLKPRLGKEWILDGFPRTLAQARLLDAEAPPDKVLLLEVPDAVCVERISGRRVCELCGREYHVKYKPPRAAGKCDVDGGRLVQRADDNEAAVRRRLAAYHEKTEPLLAHYADRLVRVNGDQSIKGVWQEIREKLGL